ncbi:hypothetical protein [Pseudomonas asplenii]|uniref:hypothetical protein n=1 Tax=Pseudomonas asplenii TaxID=53407 RepID=UPI002234BE6F|nr:hypothetical protein [Pseudomonas asplenii]UZE30271.1 hypothetical protein LOY63_05915 [Pseudomonas asplenii]
MSPTKERPILFSAPMVRAILEGRKTVTRRAVKGFQIPTEDTAIPIGDRQRWSAIGQRDPRYGFCVFGSTEAECAKELEEYAPCPYGRRGDRLWVRETFGLQVRHYGGAAGEHIVYRATNPDAIYCKSAEGQEYPVKWKPSIHMPRHSSRILLEITDLRVERLQDGEGETAFESRYVAEGINRIHQGDGDYAFHPFKSEPGPGSWTDPFDAWRELWVGINGAESWNANPWVWVVEFKRVTP